MRTVHKYPLKSGQKIPHGAKLVHVGNDPHSVFCAWFEVETENTVSNVDFIIIGTGHEIPRNARHIHSTVDGAYVWHVYADGIQ